MPVFPVCEEEWSSDDASTIEAQTVWIIKLRMNKTTWFSGEMIKKNTQKETFIYYFNIFFKPAMLRACESSREFFTPIRMSDPFCQRDIDHMARKQPDDESFLDSLPPWMRSISFTWQDSFKPVRTDSICTSAFACPSTTANLECVQKKVGKKQNKNRINFGWNSSIKQPHWADHTWQPFSLPMWSIKDELAPITKNPIQSRVYQQKGRAVTLALLMHYYRLFIHLCLVGLWWLPRAQKNKEVAQKKEEERTGKAGQPSNNQSATRWAESGW